MKMHKKIISLLLLLVMLFSLAACSGEYQYGNNVGSDKNNDNPNDSDDGFVPPAMNDDPTDDFTVTLVADGMAYTPRIEMYAYWNDGFSLHKARFDEHGVARIDGLDGDYRVTLSAVPNEYTYDPNSNVATNDDRNIVLNLYTLNRLSGGGTGLYDCYSFQKTGVYSAVINGPDDGIYFQYAPNGSGTYSIESWIDTTADNINPYIDVYYGSSQWKAYERTIDDGGAVGSYTINFVHTVEIAKENISSGGQATYTFVVKADSKNNKYPVTVTFAVKRNGDFELQRPGVSSGTGSQMAIPEHDFSDFNVADHEYDGSYRVIYPEYRYNNSSVYVFDENRFKIWKKTDGGDDFYHVYDKEKYPETNGYGPILYANITTASRFLDVAFSRIEYNSNGEVINAALSVNGKNYKHFIEGYTYLSTFGNINGGSYYCVATCPCHNAEENKENWACTRSCTNCLSDCRRCPEELIGNEGYQAYANSDGKVPVTKELRDFLQGYVGKEFFFYDGLGSLETTLVSGKQYQAVGTSGWLIYCAYYEN